MSWQDEAIPEEAFSGVATAPRWQSQAIPEEAFGNVDYSDFRPLSKPKPDATRQLLRKGAEQQEQFEIAKLRAMPPGQLQKIGAEQQKQRDQDRHDQFQDSIIRESAKSLASKDDLSDDAFAKVRDSVGDKYAFRLSDSSKKDLQDWSQAYHYAGKLFSDGSNAVIGEDAIAAATPYPMREKVLQAAQELAGEQKQQQGVGGLMQSGFARGAIDTGKAALQTVGGDPLTQSQHDFASKLAAVREQGRPRNPYPIYDPRHLAVSAASSAFPMMAATALTPPGGGALGLTGKAMKTADVASGAIGVGAGMGPQMYQEGYQRAHETGMSDNAASLTAAASTLGQTLLFSGAVSQYLPKGMTAEVANKTFAQALLSHSLKGGGYMGAAGGYDELVQQTTKSLTGKGNLDGQAVIERAIRDFGEGVGLSAVMATPNAAVEAWVHANPQHAQELAGKDKLSRKDVEQATGVSGTDENQRAKLLQTIKSQVESLARQKEPKDVPQPTPADTQAPPAQNIPEQTPQPSQGHGPTDQGVPEEEKVGEPKFYRETSVDRAEVFLPNSTTSDHTPFGKPSIFLSDNPDLALGQGVNKGVMLEFRQEGIDAKEHKIPASPLMKGKEYIAETDPMSLRNNLEAVTIRPDANSTRSEKARMMVFLNQLGWDKTVNEDGSTTWRRPGGEIKQQVPEEEKVVDPPKPPNTVRFYHGGDEYEGGKRWLTPDRKYAEGYATKNGRKGAFVHYVDIPENSPLLEKSWDDSNINVKSPYMSFEAPEEIAQQLKPLAEKVATRVVDEKGQPIVVSNFHYSPPGVEFQTSDQRPVATKKYDTGLIGYWFYPDVRKTASYGPFRSTATLDIRKPLEQDTPVTPEEWQIVRQATGGAIPEGAGNLRGRAEQLHIDLDHRLSPNEWQEIYDLRPLTWGHVIGSYTEPTSKNEHGLVPGMNKDDNAGIRHALTDIVKQSGYDGYHAHDKSWVPFDPGQIYEIDRTLHSPDWDEHSRKGTTIAETYKAYGLQPPESEAKAVSQPEPQKLPIIKTTTAAEDKAVAKKKLSIVRGNEGSQQEGRLDGRVPFYETLSPDKKEALFDHMQKVGEQSNRAWEESKNLSPRGGTIPVGGAHVDPMIKATAIDGYLRILRNGGTPEEGLEQGKADAREAVAKWNASRKGEYQVHRSEATADASLEHIARMGREVVGQQEGRPASELGAQTQGSIMPVPPGLEKDMNDAVAAGKVVADALHKTLAPATVGKVSLKAAGNVREHASELALRHEQAAAAMDDFKRALSRLPQQSQYDFIDDIETGGKTSDPKLQPAADMMRKILDEARDRIRALGKGKLDVFIKDYFPHIWKDPNAAAKIFGKRPLEGPKSFLKKRTIPTTKDGLAAGLEPVAKNPVDLVLLKLHEMNRYEMGQKIFAEGKARGYIKFAKNYKAAPQDWVKINDKIATVWQSRPTPSGGHELIHRGEYYAHPDAARIINNYLSPGLGQSEIYKAIRYTGNMLNMAQLGLSAFHLTMTSGNAIVSKAALGMKKAAKGDVAGALLSGPKAFVAPISAFMEGNRVMKEATQPGSVGGDMAAIVDHLQAGGFRLRQDQMYRLGKNANSAWDSFVNAAKEGRPSAIPQLIPAVLEQASRPLMEYFVPRMKLGIAADMARFEIDQLGPSAGRAEVREAMGKVWDSVDNRMGQLVYDNLFWNKTLKDLGMIATRSMGWNIGTFRELGGGARDLTKGDFSHRAAYLLALPLTTAFVGAVTTYLYTGHGPQQLKDYIFPPTGRKDDSGSDERLQFPTYMKDVWSLASDPVKTIANKTHPALSAVIDMLLNKDYFGTPIRNPNDPLVKQVEQEGKFMAGQFVPFSVESAMRQREQGEGLGTQAASFFGVTSAPASISRSKAQTLLHDYLGTYPAKTPEEAEERQTRRKYVQDLRAGREPEGSFTGKEKERLQKEGGHSGFAEGVKHLSLKQAIDVYEAGTESEREEIKDEIMVKYANAKKSGSVDTDTENRYGSIRGELGTYQVHKPARKKALRK